MRRHPLLNLLQGVLVLLEVLLLLLLLLLIVVTGVLQLLDAVAVLEHQVSQGHIARLENGGSTPGIV